MNQTAPTSGDHAIERPARPARAAGRVRVVVADAHEASRAATSVVLAVVGFDVVDECEDVESAVRIAGRTRPDICMIDAGLPGGALDAVARLSALPSPPRVVVLAGSASEDDLFCAVAAGASGFLLNDLTPARLGLHLEDVAAGHLAISPALVRGLVERAGHANGGDGVTRRDPPTESTGGA